MKSVAPVGILLFAILVITVIFLLDGEDEQSPSPMKEVEPATSIVSGRVVDSIGAPLVGVPVRAVDCDPSGTAAAVEAVTRDDGSFTLTVAPARGMFEVNAHPPGRAAFPLNCIVSATPLRETRILLREPKPVVAEADGPNVAGEVTDQDCRAVRGVTVVAVSKAGETVARSVTDDTGGFSMKLAGLPPFVLRIEEYPGVERRVHNLPSLHSPMQITTPKRREETLYLEPRGDINAAAHPLKVLILNSLVGRQATAEPRVEDAPWRFEGVPFGTYDIRVWNDDLTGIVRNFEFGEENRKAVVDLRAPARLNGNTEARSRAVLIPTPPMGEPICDELREDDGRSGAVRRGLMDTERRSRSFSFEHVPAGDYTLLITATGYEPLELPLALASGESRELGLIPMKKATGSAHILLNDRNEETNEHGYLLTLYTRQGDVLEYETDPGESVHLTVQNLCSGVWWARVERRMEGGTLRSIEADPSFVVRRDRQTKVEIDLTWRLD